MTSEKNSTLKEARDELRRSYTEWKKREKSYISNVSGDLTSPSRKFQLDRTFRILNNEIELLASIESDSKMARELVNVEIEKVRNEFRK